MLQQDEPDDYVIATGEEHSVREFVELAFDARRPRLGAARRHRPALHAPGRGRPAPRRRVEGARASSAGSRGSSFGELVEMMVDADLERLAATSAQVGLSV